MGYLVKLDTNGSNPKLIKELITEKLTDFIAMDIKSPFEKYSKFFAGNIELIKEIIAIIKKVRLNIYLEQPLTMIF